MRPPTALCLSAIPAFMQHLSLWSSVPKVCGFWTVPQTSVSLTSSLDKVSSPAICTQAPKACALRWHQPPFPPPVFASV